MRSESGQAVDAVAAVWNVESPAVAGLSFFWGGA